MLQPAGQSARAPSLRTTLINNNQLMNSLSVIDFIALRWELSSFLSYFYRLLYFSEFRYLGLISLLASSYSFFFPSSCSFTWLKSSLFLSWFRISKSVIYFTVSSYSRLFRWSLKKLRIGRNKAARSICSTDMFLDVQNFSSALRFFEFCISVVGSFSSCISNSLSLT